MPPSPASVHESPPRPSTPCPSCLMPPIRGCSAGSKGKLEITNDSMAPSRGGTHATLFLDSPAPSETLGAAQIDLGVRAAPATVLPVPLPLSDEADPWPRGPAVAADLLDAVRTVRAKDNPLLATTTTLACAVRREGIGRRRAAWRRQRSLPRSGSASTSPTGTAGRAWPCQWRAGQQALWSTADPGGTDGAQDRMSMCHFCASCCITLFRLQASLEHLHHGSAHRLADVHVRLSVAACSHEECEECNPGASNNRATYRSATRRRIPSTAGASRPRRHSPAPATVGV